MRKLIAIIFIIQNILLSTIILHIAQNYNYNNLIYKDKTSVLLLFDSEKEYSRKPDQYFLQIYEKYGINISKYVFVNENTVNIYTADLTLNSLIKIKEGNYPKDYSKDFISNKKLNKKEQTGTFKYFIEDKNINIFSITQTENMGTEGLYYFDTTDQELISTIISEINENMAAAEVFSVYDEKSMSPITYLTDYKNLIISFCMICILLILSLIHYILQKNRKIAILQIHGYCRLESVSTIINELLPSLVGGILFSFFMVLCSEAIKYNFKGCLDILYILLGVHIINLFLSICILFILILFQQKRKFIYLSIKGNKPCKLIFSLHYLLKYTFIIFLFLSIISLVKVIQDLNLQYNNVSAWNNTKNIYSTVLKYTGNSRDSEIKMKNFYLDMKSKNGFIIDAGNFVEIYEGTPLYKMNTSGEQIYYEADGRSIVIDGNYLLRNPIIADNNEEISEQIIYDDYCRNILVPSALKIYEKEIEQSYLENFYFQKVEVANLYNVELGLKEDKTKIDDLSINIIYVYDNQEYFTYSSVEEKNQCKIKDPIAVIETGNIDESYYNSYISRCFYFETEELDAYGSIRPVISKLDAYSNLQKVVSVYDEQGKYIQELRAERSYLILSLVVACFILIVVGYYLTSSYYEQFKYKLYIKKIFGYDHIERTKSFFILILLSDLIVAIFVALIFKNSIIFILGTAIIFWDILLCSFYSRQLEQKFFQSILKGEH